MRSHLLLLLLPLGAMAQPRPIEFPPYEISASRLPAQAARTPGATTVLDRDDIEQLQPSSTSELLASVPGLHVSSSGGLSVLHLRGADPNFTLVLIDGVQVNDPTDARGGAFDLDAIDPSEIERIEIVRGPASAVHGSDALAGVLSITTRARRGGFAELEGGALETLRVAAGVAREAFGLKLRHHQDAHEPSGREGNSQMISAHGRFALARGGRWRAHARAAQSESEHFPESSGGERLAVIRELEQQDEKSWQFGLDGARELGAASELRVQLDLFGNERERDAPAIADADSVILPATRADDRVQRSRFSAHLLHAYGRFQFGLGGELRLEDGRSDGAIDYGFALPTDFGLYRRIGGLFGELRHVGEFVTLEGALRLDASRGELPQWSPRASVQLRPNRRGGRLKASYGRAFKLPSFYALADPLVGNAALDPERSESVDVAWIQALPALRGSIELGWYRARYEDLIDFDFESFQVVNRDEVNSQGVELALRLRPHEAWDLRAELSQARTEIESSGEALRERPEWKGSVQTTWQARPALSLSLRLLYVGAVPSASIPTGERELDAYARVDLNARWTATQRLSLYASVENLGDVDYEQAIGFPAPGIFPRLGMRADF